MNLVAPVNIVELLRNLREHDEALQNEITRVLQRMREAEPTLKAFIDEPEREQRLMKQAAALESEYADRAKRPPLYGLLIGGKDLFRVDGFETRAGSRLSAELFAGQQASSVTRLVEAGALVAGKTVTTEFAYFSPGPTRNPWNLEHTPGGSSSGSSAAVAAGMCHAALGTQTIGSVIRPAAFCGIVGYKPSFGRITTDGVFPFSVSADHVGIFASDVAGVARLAAVLCRPWNHKAAAREPTHKKSVVAVPSERYLAQADAGARRAFERGLERLVNDGARIEQSSLLDDIDQINAAHNDMIAAEFAQVHAAWFDKQRKHYSEKSAELVQRGREVDSQRVSQARQDRSRLRERITQESERLGASLWASPASATAAPHGIETTGSPIMNLPWTYAGVPALTVPCGLSEDGLPLGLQLCGSYESDEALVARAARIEAILAADNDD